MKKSLVTLLVIVFASAALSAQEPLRKKHFNLEKDIVLQQYDPVADFTKNKGIEGKKGLAVAYREVTYYFSTAENKEYFKK